MWLCHQLTKERGAGPVVANVGLIRAQRGTQPKVLRAHGFNTDWSAQHHHLKLHEGVSYPCHLRASWLPHFAFKWQPSHARTTTAAQPHRDLGDDARVPLLTELEKHVVGL